MGPYRAVREAQQAYRTYLWDGVAPGEVPEHILRKADLRRQQRAKANAKKAVPAVMHPPPKAAAVAEAVPALVPHAPVHPPLAGAVPALVPRPPVHPPPAAKVASPIAAEELEYPAAPSPKWPPVVDRTPPKKRAAIDPNPTLRPKAPEKRQGLR